eukprot:3625942-Karenia_brevis.AAC.1
MVSKGSPLSTEDVKIERWWKYKAGCDTLDACMGPFKAKLYWADYLEGQDPYERLEVIHSKLPENPSAAQVKKALEHSYRQISHLVALLLICCYCCCCCCC